MIVIAWLLDLQSVPITTKVVSYYPAHDKVYSIEHYVIKFDSNLEQVGEFFSRYYVFLQE